MLTFYHVSDVKIHTSEQHLKDLGSHFEKSAFGPSMWIQILINIDFTKLGVSVLQLWCGTHVIHQPNADNLVALTEGLITFMSTYRDATSVTKNIEIQILSIHA